MKVKQQIRLCIWPTPGIQVVYIPPPNDPDALDHHLSEVYNCQLL